MNEWRESFCRDVFVDNAKSLSAASIVQGGVNAFESYHGSAPDERELKRWNEQAIWYIYGNQDSMFDKERSIEDKRIEVLEHLEKVHRKTRPGS